MADTVDHVGRVSSLIRDISRSSVDQSTGIGQIGDLVCQIDLMMSSLVTQAV